MKIAITPYNAEAYIEFEDIVSFTAPKDGWFTMTNEDGEVIWYQTSEVEFIRTMKDEFDDNEVYVESV